eukprot:TRINITY_DN2853_c0_g1_i1.p1 TRINITY_DN2853_c0_g1~~TRINITY_DN2853_c0_g1_i1.p1  ORF type:complete len:562 (-),score=191.23 TRINITY_DN2853_c0_g1_i1:35-1720(-)
MLSRLARRRTRILQPSQNLNNVRIQRFVSDGKRVVFGEEARQVMLKGVQKMSKAVSVTLGPKGRNVVIDMEYQDPKITKDGVTVAKNITFSDPEYEIGARLVRSVANKANEEAGDGTTTATILTHHIYEEGVKKISGGLNPMDIWRGINKGVKIVVEELKSMTEPVAESERIMQVATVSGNNSKAIGGLIAKAMEEVGVDGNITVESGKGIEDEIEVQKGMKFDQGYLSPTFVTDKKTSTTNFKDTSILVVDHKISDPRSLLPVLELLVKKRKPLTIISAEGMDSDVLNNLAINVAVNNLKICAVKAPGFGKNREGILEDIAVLTGADLISESGIKLEDVTEENLGSAANVIVSKNDTLIVGGNGAEEELDERCDILRSEIEQNTSDYEKNKLKERLAKLRGGVAIIKVGGSSEVEVEEKKDRYIDALHATYAAVSEGIVPGGGCALLYAGRSLKNTKSDNFDFDVGVQIVAKACEMPIRTIVKNANEEPAVVINRLLHPESGEIDTKFGYNALTGKYVNMMEDGIIDPTKVVRTALVDAASIAGLMTTTEALVLPEKKED